MNVGGNERLHPEQVLILKPISTFICFSKIYTMLKWSFESKSFQQNRSVSTKASDSIPPGKARWQFIVCVLYVYAIIVYTNYVHSQKNHWSK